MKPAKVDLALIAEWGRGFAYWAYEYVLAARPGALLAVPVHLVDGPLKDVPALCPVPYDQALAVLDYEKRIAFSDVLELSLLPDAGWPLVSAMAGEGGWFAGALPELRSRVYCHEHGTRLAVANELIAHERARAVHGQA